MYEYPFGNGQQLNLDWFLSEWKNLLAAWEAEKNGIEGALQAEIDRAEAALADVFAARDAAAQSAANALESKNAAAQSASDASGYLATVRADANTASNAAQNAAQSESNAAESAQTALASKNAAGQSERNAAQSEANALASKNAATQSAADADASKRAAAQSAADADASKRAAAQSAEDASDAAASVEASAEQIATNTTDIANLKEAFNRDTTIRNVFPTPFLPLSKLKKVGFSGTEYSCSIDNDGIININQTGTGTPQFLISGPENSQISVASTTNSELNCVYLPKGDYTIIADIIEQTNLNAYLYLRPIGLATNALGTALLNGHFERNFTINDNTSYPTGFYAVFIRYNAPMSAKIRLTIIQKPTTSMMSNAAKDVLYEAVDERE